MRDPRELFEGRRAVTDGSQRPNGVVEVKSKQFKLVAATAGTGAVLAMGALTVALSNVSVAEPEPAPPGPVTTSEITTGKTVTETVIPEAPKSPAVVPPITTTPSPIPPTAETH